MKFQLNDIIWPGVSWIFTISNIDDDNIRGWFVLYQLNLRPSDKKKICMNRGNLKNTSPIQFRNRMVEAIESK